MKTKYLGDQGEVAIYLVTEGDIPASAVAHDETDSRGRPIISHSEKGHHHVLERPAEVRFDASMDTLYALLDEPMQLKQDCADAHEKHDLPAGLIKFVIGQEYDPFLQQARRIAD